MRNPNVVRVCIEDLMVNAYLGVHDSEQEKPRKIPVYLEFEYECPSSDSLARAIDYRRVRDSVLAATEGKRYALVEIMAKTILQAVTNEPRIVRAFVKVSKMKALKQARSVSAMVEWKREK